MSKPITTDPTFWSAIEHADAADVEFSEEPIPAHGDSKNVKVGCRPIRVRGAAVPNPKLVVYVRATSDTGEYWYVLDWSQAPDSARETVVDSEFAARRLVLELLRAAHAAPSGSLA